MCNCWKQFHAKFLEMAEKDYLYDISRLRISGSKLKSMKKPHMLICTKWTYIYSKNMLFLYWESYHIVLCGILLWPLSDPNALNHEYKPPIMKNKSLYINNLNPFSFSVTVHSHIYIKACFHYHIILQWWLHLLWPLPDPCKSQSEKNETWNTFAACFTITF